MSLLRIATRGSDLALAQADYAAERVRRELGLRTERVVVKTTGDRIQHVPLAAMGGKGLFVKEIEEALLSGRADLAVHSAKDLPARPAPGLSLVAWPERADPRDALVGRRPDTTLAGLPAGARVGTGSERRRAQLLAVRPDLEIAPLRGNVPTRLARLESEPLDAVVLACAGLDRLGLGDRIGERIAPEVLLPAVCQGTLALEMRTGDERIALLEKLDDPRVAATATAERAFLLRLEGDCTTPLAVHAEWTGADVLRVRGLLASFDGKELFRGESQGPAAGAAALGRTVAEQVLDAGGRALLARLAAGEPS